MGSEAESAKVKSSRPLKVLLVGPLPPPYGGIPRYVNDLFTKGVNGVSYSIFNTALPGWVAPVDRVGAFSYRSLTENGVAEKDIQTRYFRIRQRTRWDEEKQQEVVIGYRVTNDVVAKIRDIEKVGSIIDAVVVAGGDYTRIDDLNFSVDNPSAYYDEARKEAMADAKGKAEQIAELADMKLGEPTYISESAVSPVYGGMVYELMAGGAPVPAPAPAPVPSISPGEIAISVNIQIAYSIAEKAE